MAKRKKSEQAALTRRKDEPLRVYIGQIGDALLEQPLDLWRSRALFHCATCVFYVPKGEVTETEMSIGRCRRNAPTADGWPAVYPLDSCGQHKLATSPSRG